MAFEEWLGIQRYKVHGRPSGGMVFKMENGRLILKEIVASLLATKIPAWHTRIQGAWLRKIGATLVNLDQEVMQALKEVQQGGGDHYMLAYSYPEVSRGLVYKGIMQVNLDIMNPCHLIDY